MQILPCVLDLETLTAGLTSVFSRYEPGLPPVIILTRQPNHYAGKGYGSEIVKCKLANDRVAHLVIKYEFSSSNRRQGLAYEAGIYRHILQPLQLSTPEFYGSYLDAQTNATWLVLEFLPNAFPLAETWERSSMVAAASWIGSFHARNAHASSLRPHFLKTYTVAYYVERAKIALSHAGQVDSSLSWLPDLCQHFEEFIGPLWTRSAMVHGDYYIHNILAHDGVVHPVDWEFAGLNLPEIDLACLTDGLTANMERQCEIVYQRARWPNGSPDEFERVLGAARLCLYFHNLASRPDWPREAQGLWYCKQLRALGERLGMIRMKNG